jgi:hypothetical protein
VSHPIYGDIPYLGLDGGFDLDYMPVLPPGAVRGNPHRQRFCPHCRPPKYFYVDEAIICGRCGMPFVFSAQQQRLWYEEFGFWLTSTATHCEDCRRERRATRRLQRRLAEAIHAVDHQPDDPSAHLELAEAAITHIVRTGTGNTDRAIHAARRAIKLDPRLYAARYWEARAQELAGRPDHAIEGYSRFIETARHIRRRSIRKLFDDASRRHGELRARSEFSNVKSGADCSDEHFG